MPGSSPIRTVPASWKVVPTPCCRFQGREEGVWAGPGEILVGCRDRGVTQRRASRGRGRESAGAGQVTLTRKKVRSGRDEHGQPVEQLQGREREGGLPEGPRFGESAGSRPED